MSKDILAILMIAFGLFAILLFILFYIYARNARNKKRDNDDYEDDDYDEIEKERVIDKDSDNLVDLDIEKEDINKLNIKTDNMSDYKKDGLPMEEDDPPKIPEPPEAPQDVKEDQKRKR